MSLRTTLVTALLFSILKLAAQNIDSIKYSNGYLYYHDLGKGEPIVLLSGGPGNDCSQLYEMAQKLSNDHRVILLEQRGTGRSIPKPLDSTTVNLSTAVSDVKLLLDKLKLAKATICGHSWGGSLAMYFASAHPDRVKSLILLAPAYLSLGNDLADDFSNNMLLRWSPQELALLDSLSTKIGNQSVTPDELHTFKYTLRVPYVAKRERLDTLLSKIDVDRNQQTLFYIVNDASRSKIDFRQSLKKLKAPVYIVCGKQDELASVAYELKISFPTFNLNWIQDCGHFPMFEQPDEFYDTLETVLASIAKTK